MHAINNEKKHTYEIKATKNIKLLSNNELEKHFAKKEYIYMM